MARKSETRGAVSENAWTLGFTSTELSSSSGQTRVAMACLTLQQQIVHLGLIAWGESDSSAHIGALEGGTTTHGKIRGLD